MASIISVHSYRGGTGKSNLVANVAAILAARGKRVGIVDTDIQSPGIHVLFGLEPETMQATLNDYLWGRCNIRDAAYDVSAGISGADGQPVPLNGGSVRLIPSSVNAGEIARILKEGYEVELLNEGLSWAIDELALDHLLIDTHPGLNEETLLSIAISDVLIVILRPDRQDYQGTAVTLEVARRLEVPSLHLVLNKVLPAFDFGELRERVARSFRAPVSGVVPLSEDMIRLGSGGIFSTLHADGAVTQELHAIVQRTITD